MKSTAHWIGIVLVLFVRCNLEGPDLRDAQNSNRQLELSIETSWDKTGLVTNDHESSVCRLEKDRMIFNWQEEGRSDYFAFLADTHTGDTVKTLFQGATKKGVAEISFLVSALETAKPYSWLLTRKKENDTLQRVDFIVQ